MAAPSATVRLSPVGKYLQNGWPTKIAFSRDPDVSIWEITVKPPGSDGGEPIDIKTMHNLRHVTKAPRGLIDTPNTTSKVGYDPSALSQIDALVNIPGGITWIYPDGSTDTRYGWLKSFLPDEFEDGTMPTAAIEMVISNFDATNDVEAGPVLTSVAGT